VPTRVAVSRHDITIRRPAELITTSFIGTDLERGGHFLAMEEPGLLVEDVRVFFAALRLERIAAGPACGVCFPEM
jgi:hypothetical protein